MAFENLERFLRLVESDDAIRYKLIEGPKEEFVERAVEIAARTGLSITEEDIYSALDVSDELISSEAIAGDAPETMGMGCLPSNAGLMALLARSIKNRGSV